MRKGEWLNTIEILDTVLEYFLFYITLYFLSTTFKRKFTSDFATLKLPLVTTSKIKVLAGLTPLYLHWKRSVGNTFNKAAAVSAPSVCMHWRRSGSVLSLDQPRSESTQSPIQNDCGKVCKTEENDLKIGYKCASGHGFKHISHKLCRQLYWSEANCSIRREMDSWKTWMGC